jgi:hypothetical protein
MTLGRRNIPFFPSDQDGRFFIESELRKMVNTRAELEWLIDTAASVMTEWRGFGSLRAIYCAGGYQPRDGIFVEPQIAGVSSAAANYQQRRQEIEAAETERKLAQWRREAKALPNAEPLALPAAPIIREVPKAAPPAIDRSAPLSELEEQLRTAAAEAPRRSPEESARLVDELRQGLLRGTRV